MPITQVSVSVDNTPGKLHDVCEILEQEKINIKAIMCAAKLTPVQVHFIVDDPERAENILKSNNFNVKKTEVIAVETPDHPGGLNAVLRPLVSENINIETMYPFINHNDGNAIIIIQVDKIEEAKSILKKHWIKTRSTEIYKT